MKGVWIDWKEYPKKVSLSIWRMDVWSITGKKTNVYLCDGLRFFCNTRFCYFHITVHFILFKVYYQSLNLYIHLWNVSLDGLIRWCPLITECHLLFTTASHTLHITSDSPWGFFWETWVQRSKKEGFFLFVFWHVSTHLSYLQAVETLRLTDRSCRMDRSSWVINLGFQGS